MLKKIQVIFCVCGLFFAFFSQAGYAVKFEIVEKSFFEDVSLLRNRMATISMEKKPKTIHLDIKDACEFLMARRGGIQRLTIEIEPQDLQENFPMFWDCLITFLTANLELTIFNIANSPLSMSDIYRLILALSEANNLHELGLRNIGLNPLNIITIFQFLPQQIGSLDLRGNNPSYDAEFFANLTFNLKNIFTILNIQIEGIGEQEGILAITQRNTLMARFADRSDRTIMSSELRQSYDQLKSLDTIIKMASTWSPKK